MSAWTPSTIVRGAPYSVTLSTRRTSTSSLRRDDILTLLRECDALLLIEPTCLHTRAVRGHACMKAKLWDRAVADFTTILEARPDDVHARFSRGMALFKDGRVDDAHADFSRVLALNPHHVMARYARAGCYNTEGKFHHAIEEYTIALQHDEMESDLMHGVRSGKTPRKWPHELHRSEDDRACELQRSNEQRATIDAAAWSPPRRSVELHARRESAPTTHLPSELVPVADPTTAPPSAPTAPAPTRAATKKPRKVVQVKLNLSDFVAAPTSTPLEIATTATVSTSTASLNSATQNDGLRLSSTLPPPAPPEPRVAFAPLTQRSASPTCLSSPTQMISYSSAQVDAAPSRGSVAAPTQTARRAVRRVTIAL